MGFNDKYNTDNVHFRAVIIGLLNFLNTKVQFEQVVSDDDVRMIPVPFYFYQFAGDERFMQDFYLYYKPDCDGPTKAEGNYDPVPRGVINMTTAQVNTAALVNKFVRGTYNKEVDGRIEARSAYINVIPLTIGFDVEILSNGVVESMKIVQEAISIFYKAATFNVDYKGFRVPCQIGFSEEYNVEKPITFSFGDENKVTIKFTIEMETYLPVIDNNKLTGSDMFRGDTMFHGIGNTQYAISGVSGTYASFSSEVDPSMTKDTEPDQSANTPTPPQIEP